MTTESHFLQRFEQIWVSLRRHQARLGLGLTVLAAAVGLGLLAWLDHRFELPRATRAAGLAAASLAAVVIFWRQAVAPIRWWTRPRTASEIEGRFPQLGQRIRTVVQYAGQPDELVISEGVAPSLVGALEQETEERATPLPLDRIIPGWRVPAVATLAAVPMVLLALAAIRSPEWRTAIQRAVLIERPYTTVEVTPGDVLVDQGADVAVSVEVKGRARPLVVLETRPVGKAAAPWKTEKLDAPVKGPASHRETRVARVKDPIEYRVVAGPAASGSYAIRVRYPLAIKAFEVQVTPPSYTGLDPSTTKGGDVQAVEGSVAAFRITVDEPTIEAALVMVDPTPRPAAKGHPAPGPTTLPLKREGNMLVATLDLTRDLDYQVVARTADGRTLPKNKHRIDVREDRAPRVAFDEPDEALEVHPIAEILHRARVDDDFGLARAGIVFRFNDGEDKPLILKDFPVEKGQKPRKTATLEETLLLETLAATPLDSVTYYAYAEDNFPGTPRRTETDLRYIDLRAFKREYKLAEPASGDGDPMESTTLDELIARQRVNLNRANRLARHKPSDRTEADDPLKIAGFEETLVNLTREFTEGIEQLADARVDALHKALDAMQASVDSLDRSRNAEAPPAMAEALKHLVAARRDLLFLISNNPALAARMRSFDRKQAQKIRKPRSKDEEAEQIADRLEELADEEDLVYATLAANTGAPAPAPTGEARKGEKPEPKDTEAKEAEKKDAPKAQNGEGDQGKEGTQGEGDKGKEGPKGESDSKGSPGQGQGDEGEGGSGEPKKLDRRAVAEKQEGIADEVRDLEEKLKRVEAASELARARMAKAAEMTEKASGALARGNTREATEDARTGAGMLHELARQIKGEIAREAADELAMARDLAEELARREAELAAQSGAPSPSARPGDSPGKDGKGEPGKEGKGQDGKEGQGPGSKPGQGGTPGGPGGWDGLTEGERIDRMAEMARTLEAWLKQIDKRGEGKAADAVREILDQGNVAEIVERTGRMGDLRVGGRVEEVGREAKELATRLEVLSQALELIHRGIVAPQLAAMVEFDRRLAELTARLATIKTDAEVLVWQREAAALIRDLEKAGVAGATELADALHLGGTWHWDDNHRHRIVPGPTLVALQAVSVQIKDRVQDLILKDLASARDEATPPMYRELVERYYEVLSRGDRAK